MRDDLMINRSLSFSLGLYSIYFIIFSSVDILLRVSNDSVARELVYVSVAGQLMLSLRAGAGILTVNGKKS